MNKESKEMLAILQNLHNAQSTTQHTASSVLNAQNNTNNSVPAQGNVSPDAQEMFNILSKLEQAKEQVAEEVKQEHVLTETADANNFGVGGFNIEIIDSKLAGKYKKKFYTITKDSEVVYSELSLFESAMGIVKELTHGKDVYKVQQIAKLDTQYGEYLYEAAVHKQRATQLNESISSDVAAAKHSVAVGKMSELKKQIKKLL